MGSLEIYWSILGIEKGLIEGTYNRKKEEGMKRRCEEKV
jgi:hypothetical protein